MKQEMRAGLLCFSSSMRAEWVRSRPPDVKLGERICLLPKGQSLEPWYQELRGLGVSHLVLGVEEDLGPRANQGRAGSAMAWEPFLDAFLNMQSNDFLQGDRVALLGTYRPPQSQAPLSEQVATLDEMLYELLLPIARAGLGVVLIGGGHNNAYPLLRAYAAAFEAPVSVLNIDAHPDYRDEQGGRHSGNPFRYAHQAKALDRYALLGYHEAYMPAYIMRELQADARVWLRSYESWAFADKPVAIEALLKEGIDFLVGAGSGPFALEMDIDALAFADASARSPAGFSFREARNMLRLATKRLSPCYVHLPEARVVEEDPVIVGKRLAYLVYDYLSGVVS